MDLQRLHLPHLLLRHPDRPRLRCPRTQTSGSRRQHPDDGQHHAHGNLLTYVCFTLAQVVVGNFLECPFFLTNGCARVLAIPRRLRRPRRRRHVSDRHPCRRSHRSLLPRQARQRHRYRYHRRFRRRDHLPADAGVPLLESRLGVGHADPGFRLPCPPRPGESAHPGPASTIADREGASKSQDLPPTGLRPGHDRRLLPRMGPLRPHHISDQLLSRFWRHEPHLSLPDHCHLQCSLFGRSLGFRIF